ncbi:MAG: response regulator transcription factor [Acidothermus cellulolyticus]|nr:response regulator transcription factor [Acidothermus cellulolyticus]
MARVLVVDDEAGLTDALFRGLTAVGFTVDIARDGAEAVHKATTREYDAVVLDIMLPRLSGYDVLRRLRAEDNWTPVLMLTAKDGEYDIVDALEIGADDYLTKPFSFAILIARLRALTRRKRVPGQSSLHAGALHLNLTRRKCTVGDQEISLTPREFSVLECLLRHHGQAVSKDVILREVWDENYDGDANIVEVYVGYLRRKLAEYPDAPTIRTLRGFGYLLEVEQA